MNNRRLKIRAIEVLFSLLVLVIITIVLGKYILLSITGEDMLFNAEKYLIKYTVSQYEKNNIENVVTRNHVLKTDGNGVWGLYSGDKLVADYLVQNIDNKIGIKRSSSSGYKNRVIVNISGVREYFSRSSPIVTDIPYEASNSAYYVAEQEDLFPIFGYHNVFENEEDIVDPYIDMRKNDFEEQLNFYNHHMNCRWYTLSQIVENYLIPKRKVPRNTCVMTFDDGRKNNFDIVFPLIKKYDAKATFFVIVGRSGQESYMSNWQISQLHNSGNEIGSHSLFGGSLVDTSWYVQGPFTQDTLWEEISSSKKILREYGYNTTLFAYPLGEFNDNIIATIKKSGYIAARATQKNNSWRTPRALATSMDNNFVWQLNYYEPVLKYTKEISSEVGYNGWWQFEEGAEIYNDKNNNVRILSQVKPTAQSYGVVLLENSADATTNSFIIEKTGLYVIDIFASVSEKPENISFKTMIDQAEVGISRDLTQDCVKAGEEDFCHYLIRVPLYEGEHFLTVINVQGRTGLDRFRINKLVSPQASYSVEIEEYPEGGIER